MLHRFRKITSRSFRCAEYGIPIVHVYRQCLKQGERTGCTIGEGRKSSFFPKVKGALDPGALISAGTRNSLPLKWMCIVREKQGTIQLCWIYIHPYPPLLSSTRHTVGILHVPHNSCKIATGLQLVKFCASAPPSVRLEKSLNKLDYISRRAFRARLPAVQEGNWPTREVFI